jgi:UPF0755 protein
MVKRKSRKKNKKIFWASVIVVFALCTGCLSLVAAIFVSPVMKADYELYIGSDSDYKDVIDTLENSGVVKMWKFRLLSHVFKYDNAKHGYYFLDRNSSGMSIVRKLRAGDQDEKRLTFNRLMSIEDAAGKLSRNLEIDSIALLQLLSNENFLKSYSLDNVPVTKQTVLACFIPNTYHVFWNITPEELFHRLYFEQNKFWTAELLEQAAKIKLSRLEVITLASIVELETDYNSEKAKIASVYLNRLRKGMPLQADPTIKFAMGDKTIKRVLFSHLKTQSPYNTYINKGLPPGPICTPTLSSIKAVLKNEKNPYYYFCANPDFSGTHLFAVTDAEHSENARAYHHALKTRREEKKAAKTNI